MTCGICWFFELVNNDKTNIFFLFLLSLLFVKQDMARTNFVKNFDLCIEIPYSTIICSQHIYKTIWIAVVGLELIAKSNVRKEALDYDEFSIAVFKLKKEEKK